MDATVEKTLRQERNRFVKLAFCRADLLFELDQDLHVVFAAGATKPLFGVLPERLVKRPFLNIVAEKARDGVLKRLSRHEDGSDDRIDDESIELAGPGGMALPAMVAGYRAKEYDNHFFLAIKVSLDAGGDKAVQNAILNQEEFTQAAANRVKAHQEAGGESQVTLVKVRKFKDLLQTLEVTDRAALTGAICAVLKAHSLGGDTAGQVNEESFGYAHDKSVDTERVNREVEEAAQEYLGDDDALETKSLTLDADGGGMTEDQVAKALVHTMNQFCSGKGKVTAGRLSDALDEMMNGTVDSVKFIKRVTKKKEFDLVFMPVSDLRLGKVHHFEALSRFKDKERIRDTFQIITLAENLGLIVDFDFAVIRKAIELIGEHSRQGHIPPVAVNVSSISLGNPKFVDRLHKQLARDPGVERKLMFELTESAEVEDLDAVNRVIQSFREKGFHFSLDDFGAGSASFDYLNALEVDTVKFDGPVVRRACASKRGHDLLSTMAKMCTNAGIETIGEMVEDKKMANQLFYCGIDYGQGWYFGKPDPNPFTFAEDFAGQG